MEKTLTLVGYAPWATTVKHRVWWVTGDERMTNYDAVRFIHVHEPGSKIIATFPGKQVSSTYGTEDRGDEHVNYTIHVSLFYPDQEEEYAQDS